MLKHSALGTRYSGVAIPPQALWSALRSHTYQGKRQTQHEGDRTKGTEATKLCEIECHRRGVRCFKGSVNYDKKTKGSGPKITPKTATLAPNQSTPEHPLYRFPCACMFQFECNTRHTSHVNDTEILWGESRVRSGASTRRLKQLQ